MIQQVTIENFKSIRQLSFACSRVNVFVGEPGAGKSNLLEALGMFSFAYFGGRGQLSDFVRLSGLSDLFYDRIVDHPLSIGCDDQRITLAFNSGAFQGLWSSGETRLADLYGNLGGPNLQVSGQVSGDFGFVRSYRFQPAGKLNRFESAFLMPPFGENLISVLLAHADVYQEAGRPFETIGLELNIRLPELELELQKRVKQASISYSYPYVLASDTFQRVVFFLAAIRTSQNSTLVLEEPEAHAFPYYTTSLAEDIGLDANQNQYFITTHNPYFLLPLVEKTPKDQLRVFVTYLKDYETKLRELTARELSRLDQSDLFWNLRKYAK